MTISLKTHKILWGRSGNKCAICKNELIVDATDPADDPSIVGDEAHIIARKETFTRGDFDSLTLEQRDHYSNLILLCKIHHKQIDDQLEYFTVERLRELKNIHEQEVKSKQTTEDEKRQQDDLLYSSYIDEWQRYADLDNWLNLSNMLTGALTIPKEWYNKQKEFQIWTLGRIWPFRYTSLEKALFNYSAVLQDFLNVYDKHIDFKSKDTDFLRTKKFYKIDEFNEELYFKLAHQYEAHECLVNDLFFELTRAANYICDKVRDILFSGYRIQEGLLLIERQMVGWGMKTVHVRVEYHDDERVEMPYPGLEIFKEIRYTTRDYALDPGDPGPPELDDETT
jgi:hypothetical protein